MDKLWARKSRVHGHGKTVESSWPLRGHKRGYPVDFPGRCWEIARLLRGCYAGHCAGRCADCGGNCEVICQPSCQPSCELWRGHSSASDETFPANCPDASRQLLGNCPDDSPDVARMIRRTLRRTPRRMLRGHCAAVARLAAIFFNKGMVSNQNDRLSNSRKPPKIPFD